MNSIYDTRRENLRILVTFMGSQAQFARATKCNPSMISRMLSGNPAYEQRVGGIIARRIEKQLRLEPNWMDQPPPAAMGWHLPQHQST